MVLDSENRLVPDPPNRWASSYPYPESWDGWAWGDHPSLVARAIMKAFVKKGYTPDKLTMSSISLPMDNVVRTEPVDPQRIFDFMNGLHHLAHAAVTAMRHDAIIPNEEYDKVCKTLISLLE